MQARKEYTKSTSYPVDINPYNEELNLVETHPANEAFKAQNPFSQLVLKAQQFLGDYKTPITLAITDSEKDNISAFTKKRYETLFPQVSFNKSCDYNANTFCFYTTNEQGEILSTASLVIDSDNGFPEESLLKNDIEHYRASGKKCLQIGRFVINAKKRKPKSAVGKTIF